jgi:hypothetical protein
MSTKIVETRPVCGDTAQGLQRKADSLWDGWLQAVTSLAKFRKSMSRRREAALARDDGLTCHM